jgi:hypothetical protein
MAKSLRSRGDIYIFDGIKRSKSISMRAFEKYVPLWPKREIRFFVRKMLESYVALCPRGHGGSSFRFFEAMQLGVVPFLIGDLDTRPFKRFINWDELSSFSQSVSEVNEILDSLKEADLILMGKKAAEIWKTELTYQKWCKYVLWELETLR